MDGIRGGNMKGVPEGPFLDAILLAEELGFATPRFESYVEDAGSPSLPPHLNRDPDWVAAAFLLIPSSDTFTSSPVTILLGERRR